MAVTTETSEAVENTQPPDVWSTLEPHWVQDSTDMESVGPVSCQSHYGETAGAL